MSRNKVPCYYCGVKCFKNKTWLRTIHQKGFGPRMILTCINCRDKVGESGELEGKEARAILDDAKREMFGPDADLLDDDMGAK